MLDRKKEPYLYVEIKGLAPNVILVLQQLVSTGVIRAICRKGILVIGRGTATTATLERMLSRWKKKQHKRKE